MSENPYHRMRRSQLYAAAQNRARELLQQPGAVQRTPAERAALAQDTGHLLLSLAWYLMDNELLIGTPQERVKRGEGLAETFMAHYLKEARGLRHQVHAEALDMALRAASAPLSLAVGGAANQYPHNVAANSDEKLAAALAAVEQLYLKRLEGEVRHQDPPGERE